MQLQETWKPQKKNRLLKFVLVCELIFISLVSTEQLELKSNETQELLSWGILEFLY